MIDDLQEGKPRQVSDLIRGGIFEYLKDVHTALPGVIESFDAGEQLAKVRPAIKRVFKTSDGEAVTTTPQELPLLINVPVIFPAGNGWHLTFPVTKGDECLIIFCERSIEGWRNDGGVVEPSAKRFHALNDAVAIMGLHSKPQKISDYSESAIELRTTGNKISIAEGLTTLKGNVKIEGNVEINGNTTQQGNVSTTGNVATTGNSTVSGALAVAGALSNAGKNVGSSHTHPYTDDGNARTTGAPN